MPNKKTRNRIHVSTGNPDLDRAFGQVYDDLNDINNKVVQPKTVEKAKNTDKVKGVEINDSDKADGKSLVFNSKTNKLDYKTITGGSGGGATTYKELTGVLALNTQTDGNETLDGNHKYVQDDEFIISSGDTITISDTKELIIDNIKIDVASIEKSIENNTANISTNTSNISSNSASIIANTNEINNVKIISEDVQLENQQILDNIDALGEAHNRLREIIVDSSNFIDASSDIEDDNYTIYEDSQ